MSSLYRKCGSPFWFVQFVDPDGKPFRPGADVSDVGDPDLVGGAGAGATAKRLGSMGWSSLLSVVLTQSPVTTTSAQIVTLLGSEPNYKLRVFNSLASLRSLILDEAPLKNPRGPYLPATISP